MRRHVAATAPEEACGLLAGASDEARVVYPIANALRSPVRFRMDPREQLAAFKQIEAAGLDLVAIFHSHPNGPAVPSPTDIDESAYPVANLIWTTRDGVWNARGYLIHDGRFSEITLQVINDQ